MGDFHFHKVEVTDNQLTAVIGAVTSQSFPLGLRPLASQLCSFVQKSSSDGGRPGYTRDMQAGNITHIGYLEKWSVPIPARNQLLDVVRLSVVHLAEEWHRGYEQLVLGPWPDVSGQ